MPTVEQYRRMISDQIDKVEQISQELAEIFEQAEGQYDTQEDSEYLQVMGITEELADGFTQIIQESWTRRQ